MARGRARGIVNLPRHHHHLQSHLHQPSLLNRQSRRLKNHRQS
jgi:hypothetical protein